MMRQEPFERSVTRSSGVIGYCDHCGFAIYHARDMLLIGVNGDRIHTDCWAEYAEEHMLEFAKCAGGDDDFDCDI